MNGNLTKQIMSLLLALVLLMSNVPATAFATEETEATQPAAEAMSRAVQTELGATIEQQVRAFAKAINKTDADDDAAWALAKHGMTGGGKKLSVGKSHALTAVLMNSELGLATLIRGCELGIQQMQQLNLSEGFVLGGCYWGSDPLNFFNIIHPKLVDENASVIYDAEEANFTGKANGYDSSLEWIAGGANVRTTITKAKVTADTVTYNVTVSFEDRFDFSTSSNSGFKNLISGIGALLFKEFDWVATATFSLTVDNGCPHDSNAYYWRYDAGAQNMASVTTDEFGKNQAKKHTIGSASHYYELDQTVTLLHNVPWELEYTVKNPVQMLLSPTRRSFNDYFDFYLYSRNHFFIQNTERIKDTYKHHCYGYTFANLFHFTWDQTYTIRLENVIAENGSNMIYVSVYNHDLQQTVLEQLPMDDYYWMQGGVLTLQDDESRGLSGEDLRIQYIGNANYPFASEIFELKVWENGKNGGSDSCFTDKLTKPTCSAKGYTTHTCALCGYSYKDTYTAKIPHTYGKWTASKIATCTEEGEERRDCTNCDHYETRDVAALGHDITHHQAQVVTCTVIGWNAYDTCSRCDYSTYVEISATGHNYGAWIETKAPTCTAIGTERRDCNACDHFETCDIAALGHDKVAHTAKAPTCTETGWEAYETCSRCAYTTCEKIAATGHKHNAVVTAPTCLERGYTAHTCHCGNTYVDTYVNALGHNMGAWYVIQESSCTETGTQRRDCSRCDYYETEAVAVNDHSYTDIVTAPTCTAQGYTAHTCHCGNTYVDTYVNALGHNMGAWYVIQESSCTETGTQRRDCSRCDYYETEAVAANDHSYTDIVTAPTCTAQGYTTHTCHCGDTYQDTYVGALGHDMGQWYTTKEPSCTQTGTQRKDCSRCNYYENETIAAAGHSYVSAVVKPTPDKQGYTEYTCHCGDSYRTDYVAALDLSAPKVSVAKDADTGKPTLRWKNAGEGVTYEIYRATSKSGKYTKVATVEEPSWIDTAASVGKTYYYKVKSVYAEDTSLNSDFGTAISATAKCAAPTLTVETGSSGKPVLTWNKISGAKKYEIWRSVDGGAFKKLTTSTKTTYTDSKASAGTKYTYKVKALGSKSAYNGEFSQPDSCYATCAAPSITLKLDSKTGKPSLSWKKVSGATSYAVYRRENSGEYKLLTTTTSVSYKDQNAAIDNRYSYYVMTLGKTQVFNSVASAAKSITLAVKTPKLTGGATPEGKPVVNWAAVENAAFYEVYRSTRSSKYYTLVETTTELSYTDTSVATGKSYYYKVVAVGENTQSAQSPYLKLSGKCATPTIQVTLDEDSGRPMITWEKIDGAKKYTVYRATSESGKYKKLGTTSKLVYTDTEASVGSEYFYKIVANPSSSSCNSAYSNVESCRAICGKASVTVKVDASSGKLSLSWKKVTGAKLYEIYRSENGGVYTLIATQKGVSYKDNAVTPGYIYSYQVKVISSKTNADSFLSNEKIAAATCATPKLKGKVGATGKPALTWGAVEGATNYLVYRSTSKSKGYQVIDETEALTFTDTTAVKGKTYYYKVVAVSGSTESTQSSYAKVKSK